MPISLPIGKWRFNGNSFRGELNVDRVDLDGTLTGTALIDAPRV